MVKVGTIMCEINVLDMKRPLCDNEESSGKVRKSVTTVA